MSLTSNLVTRLFLLLTLCGAIAGSTGCATDRAVIQQAGQFHTQLQPAVVNDPVLDNYIQSVSDRIIASARELQAEGVIPEASRDQDNSWMFSGGVKAHFVNSDTINAFTTGGEHLYIYSELFEQCGSEDELAAVMAHEFAHVYGRHVHKGMNRQIGLMATAVGVGAATYALTEGDDRETYAMGAGGAAMALGQIYGMSRTRGDEDEADRYGFAMYVRAGYDPEKFADFFQRIIDMGMDQGTEFLSDHPKLSTRVENTRQRARKLPPEADQWRRPPIANAREFRELQARSKQIGATMPSDKTLGGTQDLLAALPRSCLTPAVREDQIAANQRIAKRAELVEQAQEQQQQQQRR